MTEAGFERELKRFDPSLWLVRKEDGWSLMGVDNQHKPYCVLAHIPIGCLGYHIIENIHANTPFKSGERVEDYCRDINDDLPGHAREKDVEEAKVWDMTKDFVASDLPWAENRRVAVTSFLGDIPVNDFRRPELVSA